MYHDSFDTITAFDRRNKATRTNVESSGVCAFWRGNYPVGFVWLSGSNNKGIPYRSRAEIFGGREKSTKQLFKTRSSRAEKSFGVNGTLALRHTRRHVLSSLLFQNERSKNKKHKHKTVLWCDVRRGTFFFVVVVICVVANLFARQTERTAQQLMQMSRMTPAQTLTRPYIEHAKATGGNPLV